MSPVRIGYYIRLRFIRKYFLYGIRDEVLFQRNGHLRLNLDREVILSLKSSCFINSSILDNISREINIIQLAEAKGKCQRLSLTLFDTSDYIRRFKKEGFVEVEDDKKCIARFLKIIEIYLYLTEEDFKREELEYVSYIC
ncbi:hypothetical protein LIER_22618 [Lithospermum erythrorhizon]|uniref:Uncharacterized protein n=1 Tax=Lithospermum erythrorhizon TaxID=34254 RepID=A0AAV3QWU3_LITER